MLTTAIIVLGSCASNSTRGIVKHAIRFLMLIDTVIWLRPYELIHQDLILGCTVLVITWALFSEQISSLYARVLKIVYKQILSRDFLSMLPRSQLPAPLLACETSGSQRNWLVAQLLHMFLAASNKTDKSRPRSSREISDALSSDEFQGFSDSEMELDSQCEWPGLFPDSSSI